MALTVGADVDLCGFGGFQQQWEVVCKMEDRFNGDMYREVVGNLPGEACPDFWVGCVAHGAEVEVIAFDGAAEYGFFREVFAVSDDEREEALWILCLKIVCIIKFLAVFQDTDDPLSRDAVGKQVVLRSHKPCFSFSQVARHFRFNDPDFPGIFDSWVFKTPDKMVCAAICAFMRASTAEGIPFVGNEGVHVVHG